MKIGRGYDWENGKSNNAVMAEEFGLFPASTLAQGYNIESKAIKELLVPKEWHHTSCAFNRTDYYSEEEVKENIDALKERTREIRAERAKKLKDVFVFYDCNVEWVETVREWNRRRGRYTFEDRCITVKAKKVEAKGSTFTIFPKDGGKPFRKRSCEVTVNSARGLLDVADTLIIPAFEAIEKYFGSPYWRNKSGHTIGLRWLAVDGDIGEWAKSVKIAKKAIKSFSKKHAEVAFYLKKFEEDHKNHQKEKKMNEKKLLAFKKENARQMSREMFHAFRKLFGEEVEVACDRWLGRLPEVERFKIERSAFKANAASHTLYISVFGCNFLPSFIKKFLSGYYDARASDTPNKHDCVYIHDTLFYKSYKKRGGSRK
jgi:hypothetical protein